MYFKYVPESTEVGVQIAGSIHGAVFMVYLGVTWFTADVLGWSVTTRLLGLAAGVPPFGSVVFERWVSRRGLLTAPRAVPT
jgi:integral membrane protein